MDATPFSTTAPEKAIDGTTSTYAQATSATPWSLTVDLGSDKTFNQVVYTTDTVNHATNYTIDVATAAAPTTWTTVSTQTSNDGTPKTLNFTAVTARYVKLHVTAAVSGGNWGHGVYEFAVYNTSGGTQQTVSIVTASSSETGNPASNVIDGSTTNRWAAVDGTFPQWVNMDLGSTKSVNDVKTAFYNPDGRTYTYNIQVSTDNVTYTTVVASKSTNSSVWQDDAFTAANARYVKINITATSGSGFASVLEAQVYSP